MDPDGRYTIDEDTKTIVANLNDKQDMVAASKAFFILQSDGYKCRAEGKYTENTITFNNARGMFYFLDGSYDQYQSDDEFYYDSLVFDLLGVSTSSAPSNSISGITSKILSITATTSDLKSTITNFYSRNTLAGIDSSVDLIIDVIGFAGVNGACISVGLKYSKKGITFGITQMARFQIELERYIVNEWTNSLCGKKFK